MPVNLSVAASRSVSAGGTVSMVSGIEIWTSPSASVKETTTRYLPSGSGAGASGGCASPVTQPASSAQPKSRQM